MLGKVCVLGGEAGGEGKEGSGGRGETKGKQRERRGGKNGKSKKKKKINEPWGRISKGEERDRRLCARGNPFFSSLSLFPGPFCSKKPPSIFSFLSDPAVTLSSPKTDQRKPFHQKRKFGGGVFFSNNPRNSNRCVGV